MYMFIWYKTMIKTKEEKEILINASVEKKDIFKIESREIQHVVYKKILFSAFFLFSEANKELLEIYGGSN